MLKIRLKLIEGWQLALKFWSIRLGVIGSFVTSLFIMWPDSALYFWNAMPDDIKYHIPEQYVPMIGVVIFVMSMAARLVRQQKVEEKIEEKKHAKHSSK